MDAIEKLKFVYFMLGIMLATAVYANLLVLATPSNDFMQSSQGISLLSNSIENREIIVPVISVSDFTNKGSIASMLIQGIPGNSQIYLRTNPYIDPTLQYSSNIASQVAKRYIENDEMDFIITYDISSNYLGGESAGAAKTLAMIAIYTNQSIRKDTIITGVIYPNGRIGFVEEIPEKIKTAANNGFKRILIPEIHRKIDFSDRFILRRDFSTSSLEDIKNYSFEKYGIEVISVKNIDEVIESMLI